MVKNIIKRIIVGVGIALCLYAIKGNLLLGVSAKQIASNSFGGVSYEFDAATTSYLWDVPNGYWTSWNSGLLYGSVSVHKLTGSSTSSFNPVRAIIARSDNGQEFQCFFGSSNVTNSTHVEQIISYYCPMNMGANGLESISFVFVNSGIADWTAKLYINGTLTFVQDDNFSTSGIISAQNNTTNAINNNTNAINDTNNTIKSEESPDTNSFLSDITPDYSNNPVSDLITMPITFLQTLNNNSSGSCVNWDLGNLLGTNLTMPCINLQNILGSRLYNLIDMAICLFLAYNLGLMCVTIWNNITSLKDDFDNMYSPKGYPMEQIRSDD